MQRYLDINEDQALKLREGLELLETLDRDAVAGLELYIYGLTSDLQVLDAAREAIASDYEEEISEEDVQIGEIAIAIPISSDTIYALTGSGIRLQKEYFAYAGSEGEGTRRSYLYNSNYRPIVTLHSFSHLALAESDSWIDDYLEKTGGKGIAPTEIKRKIQRTEEATQPVPVLEKPVTPKAPQPTTPKQTSFNLNRLMEDFLG